jgi:hypothetical protein
MLNISVSRPTAEGSYDDLQHPDVYVFYVGALVDSGPSPILLRDCTTRWFRRQGSALPRRDPRSSVVDPL